MQTGDSLTKAVPKPCKHTDVREWGKIYGSFSLTLTRQKQNKTESNNDTFWNANVLKRYFYSMNVRGKGTEDATDAQTAASAASVLHG